MCASPAGILSSQTPAAGRRRDTIVNRFPGKRLADWQTQHRGGGWLSRLAHAQWQPSKGYSGSSENDISSLPGKRVEQQLADVLDKCNPNAPHFERKTQAHRCRSQRVLCTSCVIFFFFFRNPTFPDRKIWRDIPQGAAASKSAVANQESQVEAATRPLEKGEAAKVNKH